MLVELRQKSAEAVLVATIGAETAVKVAAQSPARLVEPLLASPDISQTINTPAVASENGLEELMAQALKAREQARAMRERVRKINSEIIASRGTWSAGLKEKYSNAVEELSAALGAANRSRAQLIAALHRFRQTSD